MLFLRLKYSPLVVVTSCLDEKKKKTLKTNIHKLGGHIINDWRQNTVTHLVMDGLTFTIKVIHALAECSPIVKPSYFDDVIDIMNASSTLPPVESYLPPLKEETISSQVTSFLPNETRKTLFSGKTFIFISKKQYKRVQHAVESSGGSTLLRDAPGSETDECLVSRDVCVMMMDIKEQNKLPAASQQWILHVMEALKRHRCRPIPESELGLALLFMSLDKYCNPSITAVPPLTQNLVSQSFQGADIMSQQFTAQETQFKRPPIPVRHTKEDTTQGTCEQLSTDIHKTTYIGKRCSTESVVESLPDNQSVSSTKKRKMMEIETSAVSETTLVSESMDENKHEPKAPGNLKLELADSIVADSLEVKHDSSSECDLEAQEKKNELMSKVENVADSLDVNDNSHMAMDKSQSRSSLFNVRHSLQPSERETQVNDQDKSCEGEVSQSLARQNTSNTAATDQRDTAQLLNDLHVPAGFLCSRIPRKVSRKYVFEDEEPHLPRNLVVVDQMLLVVQTLPTTPTVQKTTHNTITKNFKKFKKQLYPGSCVSLPRIIGGSDLTIYQSSGRLDKDEWFLEAREADVERQREEMLAEELFR
ncbi:hypothetical protein OS493_001656 [Desmophyllum pertusum]|uniref:BRCT domain-containing protein n=1 Tax=Desmophyllum pertusum TaxID=174260 RepID=A0A9X0D0S2_9CNID|nr:hypothetical protein OS493_001656 [Desmophyllum pertusum]